MFTVLFILCTFCFKFKVLFTCSTFYFHTRSSVQQWGGSARLASSKLIQQLLLNLKELLFLGKGSVKKEEKNGLLPYTGGGSPMVLKKAYCFLGCKKG